MGRPKKTALPVPVMPGPGFKVEARLLTEVAAEALMNAFDWDKHPWGGDFWGDLHKELTRLSALARKRGNIALPRELD